MPQLRNKTAWVMAVFLIALVGWDAYVYFGKGDVNATISRIIASLAVRSWTILVIWGVLMGHFFWVRKSGPVPKTWLFGPVALVLVGLDFAAGLAADNSVLGRVHQGGAKLWPGLVILGAALGRLLWPQTIPERAGKENA